MLPQPAGKNLVISELKAANTKGQGRLSLVSGPKASKTLGTHRFFLGRLGLSLPKPFEHADYSRFLHPRLTRNNAGG